MGGGLRLEAEWTKNRRPGFQPLPRYLLEKLAGTGASPSEALLQVPSHPARTFDEDLRVAGIGKASADGVLVFHSWRATYGTLLDELGASPKETQELMRHATPVLTMQRYVQARLDRRQQLVEDMANVIWSDRGVPGTLEVGTDEDVTTFKFNGLRKLEEMEAVGIEPNPVSAPRSPNPQNKPRSGVVTGPDAPTPTIPLPPENHPKPTDFAIRSAPGVPEDPALWAVIAAWSGLSSEDRQRILAIVHGRGAP